MTTTPKLSELTGNQRNNWMLDEDCSITTMGYTFFIPQGFITDGSSVPRAFWAFDGPWDSGSRAPLVHDWLYRHGGWGILILPNAPPPTFISSVVQRELFTRSQTDGFFLDLMHQDGVSWFQRTREYLGVRLGGASSFRSTPFYGLNP